MNNNGEPVITDHERAAMEAAAKQAGYGFVTVGMQSFWEQARKYKPPAVCGAPLPQFDTTSRCELEQDHPGDHRNEIHPKGLYIGWPRT